MELTVEEKIWKLEEAQAMLLDVIELIESVFPDNASIKAYLTDHLRIYASDEHGFVTSDPNLSELISKIEEERGESREMKQKGKKKRRNE